MTIFVIHEISRNIFCDIIYSSDDNSSADSDFEYETSDSDSENFDSASDIELASNASEASSVDDIPGAWNMIVDPFQDTRPDPLPEFLGLAGTNPDIFPEDELPFTRAVNSFLTDEVWVHLVECTNEKATAFFEAAPERDNKINGLPWHEVTVAEMKVHGQ
jgi:hypothetical protein